MGYYLIMSWKSDGTPDELRPITEACASEYLSSKMQSMLTSDYKMKIDVEEKKQKTREQEELFWSKIKY